MRFVLNTVEEAVEDIRLGKIVVVMDDEDRENEGDLICASSLTTPAMVNFMATHGRGLICNAITAKRAKELELKMMVENNTSNFSTAFTISVDGVEDVTTGISAFDRAHTINRLADNQFKAADFARPGHIFPLIANDAGVLGRRGQTEAAVDLAKMAGLEPAGVLCEIMSADGSMARLAECTKLAEKYDLKIISVEQMIQYKMNLKKETNREEQNA